MNRINLGEHKPSNNALDRLHRANYSIGDVAFAVDLVGRVDFDSRT